MPISYRGIAPRGEVGAAPTAPSRLVAWLADCAVVSWLFLASGAVFPLLMLGDMPADSTAGARATLRLLTLPSLVLAPALLLARLPAMGALLLRHPLLP